MRASASRAIGRIDVRMLSVLIEGRLHPALAGAVSATTWGLLESADRRLFGSHYSPMLRSSGNWLRGAGLPVGRFRAPRAERGGGSTSHSTGFASACRSRSAASPSEWPWASTLACTRSRTLSTLPGESGTPSALELEGGYPRRLDRDCQLAAGQVSASFRTLSSCCPIASGFVGSRMRPAVTDGLCVPFRWAVPAALSHLVVDHLELAAGLELA
jgi:hypothetical protein